MVVYIFPWGNLSQRNKIQNVRFFKQHPLCLGLTPVDLWPPLVKKLQFQKELMQKELAKSIENKT